MDRAMHNTKESVQDIYKVEILTAIFWVKSAWEEISQSTKIGEIAAYLWKGMNFRVCLLHMSI